MADYIALLLFETVVAGQCVSYTEEFHLLTAESNAEAQAQAEARGQAGEQRYLNEAGQEVAYSLLCVVDVRPYLFGDMEEAIYTRSFERLEAYREVASLR